MGYLWFIIVTLRIYIVHTHFIKWALFNQNGNSPVVSYSHRAYSSALQNVPLYQPTYFVLQCCSEVANLHGMLFLLPGDFDIPSQGLQPTTDKQQPKYSATPDWFNQCNAMQCNVRIGLEDLDFELMQLPRPTPSS